MAIGDQNDMFTRIKRNLVNWFGYTKTVPDPNTPTPVLDALLEGVAETDAFIYSLIQDAELQTRIKTATGFYLDLISQDFFGNNLPRKPSESDFSFRTRILANLLPRQCTRNNIAQIIFNLTNIEPIMIEGFTPLNVGAYDISLFYDVGFGYGDYTSNLAYTGIIYAFLPQPKGFYGISGIGFYDGVTPVYQDTGFFGYDFFWNNAYIDLSQEVVSVDTNDLVIAIKNAKVYGTQIYLYVNGVYYAGNPI